MGKFVLGISRSEVASKIFINACSEFVFLESVSAPQRTKTARTANEPAETGDIHELTDIILSILEEQGDADDMMFASELKNTLVRLRPDFSERAYGFVTFGKLIADIAQKTGSIRLSDNNNILRVGLAAGHEESKLTPMLVTKDNWIDVFSDLLEDFKADGFERLNPSVIKETLQNEYPEFSERELGFKKFSDVLKRLEKEKKLKIEFDESHSMLVKIL